MRSMSKIMASYSDTEYKNIKNKPAKHETKFGQTLFVQQNSIMVFCSLVQHLKTVVVKAKLT
jgi:hypothetical protein